MTQSAVGRHLRRAGRRLFAGADHVLFPEARTASEHWQRRVMNDAVASHVNALGPESLSAFEVSGDAYAQVPWSAYVSLDYPEFDLCAPLESDQTYDVVICEQVLEHVVDPCAAARNLRLLCSDGGTVIVSTPFLIRVHELPEYGLKDFWRFTPRGLERLLVTSGFAEVDVHSWGNRECVVGNLSRWSRYKSWMPLRNDPELPVQVWAYASP